MKKKGFTLIELIVVIAIIGVLAAILIPAMLGYIKRSKITNANAAAKQLMTACASAITDIDAEDHGDGWAITDIGGEDVDYAAGIAGTAWNTTVANGDWDGGSVDGRFQYKVYNYFNDITELTTVALQFGTRGSGSNGNVIATAVLNGQYPGTNPQQASVDVFDQNEGWGIDDWLTYAQGTAAGEGDD